VRMRYLCVLGVLGGLFQSSLALDREAFTSTKYDLTIRIEPEQQRLAAEGKITLRNDSSEPQKHLSLQISSTLGWRSIRFEGKPVDFLPQAYTSDIDHTGSLSEAIVTLPHEIPPKSIIELDVRYEGTIPLDATRLTRIGVPENLAKHSDWDQISPAFTALRGAGHVVWYPVAMESANLSEGNSTFETLGRWSARTARASMRISLCEVADAGKGQSWLMNNPPPQGASGGGLAAAGHENTATCGEHLFPEVGEIVPVILGGAYADLQQGAIDVHYALDHRTAAQTYATLAAKTLPFVTEWFGRPRVKVEVAELPDPQAAPFESGPMLLTPLGNIDPGLAEIAIVHQLTHASFSSPRLWIYEGLAHFAQALYLERQRGRDAALDFMGLHRSAVTGAEKAIAQKRDPRNAADQSLINTFTEEFYRSKAAYVWWMLRDMVGETALKKALASYHPDQDNEPSYMQRLIEAQAHRDLEWFFDDWVYRDRGLPDFRVDSVYPRPIVSGGYMLTVTLENLGTAGAEVPVILKMEEGDLRKRLEVGAKSKNSIRFEVPTLPSEVVVNDGSVPESDATNNTFKIEGAAK